MKQNGIGGLEMCYNSSGMIEGEVRNLKYVIKKCRRAI